MCRIELVGGDTTLSQLAERALERHDRNSHGN
jgi:hypothetical protein